MGIKQTRIYFEKQIFYLFNASQWRSTMCKVHSDPVV